MFLFLPITPLEKVCQYPWEALGTDRETNIQINSDIRLLYRFICIAYEWEKLPFQLIWVLRYTVHLSLEGNGTDTAIS